MLLNTLILKVSALLSGLSSFTHEAIMDDSPAIQSPLVGQSGSGSFVAEDGLMLSDFLTKENSLSIFYTYARETQLGQLFESQGSRITVFAPTNKAVMALPRKP